MSGQKIVIEITESNEAPTVTVDGEEVKVVSLNYNYETCSCDSPGEHKFNLVIPDIIDGRFQTKGIAFDRNVKLD